MKVRKSEIKPDYSIDSSSVELRGTSGYSEKVINYARQLKATQPGHPDSFYLEYAQSHFKTMSARDDIRRSAGKLSGFAIQDSKWSAYTYDEIIAMSNGGYNVPEEVLAWAYAMQEKDIVNYILDPEDVSAFDVESINDLKSDKDINNIQKNTAQSITQVQKTTTALEEEFEEFKVISNRAFDIKTEKENSYKKQVEDLNNNIKEWKNLNNKSKQDNLDENEKIRFEELSGILKDRSSEIIEIKNDNKDLIEFLSSLNKLTKNLQTGTDIAQGTIDTIENMTRLDKGISSRKIYDKNNITSNKMSAASIPDLGYQAVNNLQNTTAKITASLSDSNITSTTAFANGYTTAVNENIEDFEISDLNNEADLEENSVNEEVQETEKLEDEITTPDDKETPKEKEPVNSNKQDEKDDIENILNPKKQTSQNQRKIQPRIEQSALLNILDSLQTEQKSQETSLQQEIKLAQDKNPEKDLTNNVQNLKTEIKNTVNSVENTVAPTSFNETEDNTTENNTEQEIANEKTIKVDKKTDLTAQEQLSSQVEDSARDIKIAGSKKLDKLEVINIPDVKAENKEQPEQRELTTPPETEEFETEQNILSEPEIDTDKKSDEVEEQENSEQTPQAKEYEELKQELPQTITTDNIAHAASASANANITKATSTTDKEEKRLTRFNNDSIIESKKKKKRVMEVSSARGGSVNS